MEQPIFSKVWLVNKLNSSNPIPKESETSLTLRSKRTRKTSKPSSSRSRGKSFLNIKLTC